MLIVLPPSETKAIGGNDAPLNVDALSFPTLNPIRNRITKDLSSLSPDQALTIFKLSRGLPEEVLANTELFHAPTMPALLRYTGVLYDALDASTIPRSAWSRLAIGSALFGVVGASDAIPRYRLSGSTKLPASDGTIPTMKKRWGSAITKALVDTGDFIVDLRSGTYQQLGKVPGATTVRVESVQSDGTRKVISHFNKHYKGELARVLVLSDTNPSSTEEVGEVARQAGLPVEQTGSTELTFEVQS
ncbi:peroxide stress protein YaaA [Corynebacterium pseudotuberculosis]|uniref:peroxide stress protein YaaA n=1 Tax=Corynebacterium pseudotuberculosis TaxID=1719 RepID=UPI00059B659D|nr:peroxide stress protein YaaA [Corynebacterium pseudotuberculosis]